MSEFPKGWTQTTLGQACIRASKVNPKDDPDKEITYLDIGGIDNQSFKIGETKTYSGADAPSRARQLVEEGDVLFSTVRTYLKKIAQVSAQYDGGVASTGFTVLRGGEALDPKFLFYYVTQDSFIKPLSKIQRGTSYPAVRDSDVLEQPIVVAPLPEQRRIVARIEELFSRLDAGVAALRHAKAQLQRYRQSVLAAAVTGQLTQAWREKADVTLSEWESVTIDDISEVKTGKTPKRGEPHFWTNGTIPWLTSSATSNDFTHEADQFVTKAALDSGLKLFEPGTLLLAMYGEGKTRGQITEITFRATCNQACAAIIINDARAFRPFVKLRLQECYEQTRKAASGGNQPNLNLTKVREIPLQLPPLAEQHQIVAEVEARTTAIDHLEAELDRQITRSNRLRQSTLASAFAGTLLPITSSPCL